MGAAWLHAGILVAACVTACRPSDPPGSTAQVPAAVTGLTAPRATHAPQLDQLEGLDPAAAEAIRSAAAELQRDVDRPESWTQLGILLHAHRRFESAGECYEQSLLRDPDDARSWYYRALVNDQLGSTDRAELDLERCLSLERAYPPAHWRLGLLQLGRGDLERAEASMQAALKIAPQDAASIVGMARVRMQQGAGEEAVELLEAHTGRMPSDDNARFLLGTAYRQVGRMEDAARVLAASAAADPIRNDPWQAEILGHRRGYRAEFLEANDQLSRGELDQAISSLQSLQERQPDDTLVQLSLHRALRANGAIDEAIGLLLATREREPLHEMVHLHLAGAYLAKARQAGSPPDAFLLEAARESSARARTLAPSYANAHGMHGEILDELGQTEAATESFLRAADLGPGSVMWHRLSARSLCAAGRWKDALRILGRLDQLEPDSPRTLYFIGVALGSTGRLEEAHVALARAAQLAPDDRPIADALDRVSSALAGDAAGPGNESRAE